MPRGRPPYQDLLTPAEWRVLHAVRHDLTNRVIAERMQLSINAIKYHIRNILEKTGLPNKRALRSFDQQPKHVSNLPLSKKETTMSKHSVLESIGQIARSVSDINQSRNWYELILELPLLYTFPNMAFFNCNGTRLMLNQAETINTNESIIYFHVENIFQTHLNFQKKGVEFVSAPHRIHQHEDGSEEWMAFFNDPDNRPLGLMSSTAEQQKS